MLDFTVLGAFALLSSQFVAFVKFLVDKDKNGIVTTLLVWLAGISVVMLFAKSNFVIPIGDVNLGDLNFWSQIIAGLAVGGSASGIYNFRKAFDTSDSAKEPALFDS